MTLTDLGYNQELESFRAEQNLLSLDVGRVIAEHRERYVVKTSEGDFDAELLGNLRFAAASRRDFPAVGDWVALSKYDESKALIHALFPRSSIIERQAVGKKGHSQIMATNIDAGLIVQAVDRDFNLNRLERYLTICHAANVEPIVVLSKIDLIDDIELEKLVQELQQRLAGLTIFTVSNQMVDGYEKLIQFIQKGKTYCLLGSSGVGKSTLLNSISGEFLMKTGQISSSVQKGRHITSHRELIVMRGGGILIDNPGLREVGMADVSGGLGVTFEAIIEYAQHCKFKDCTHTSEHGCAVLAAVEEGEIDADMYANFRKLEKEKLHFESDIQQRKQKDKEMGKMIKRIQKQRRDLKY